MSGGRRAVVVSISPQSRASLAYAAGIDPLDAARRLTGFFKFMVGVLFSLLSPSLSQVDL
jgi:hypothetical protein